jgi:hypothetical protein
MAFDHFQVATQGLGPGWTTFNAALQGFGFDVEIIVVPPVGGGGGGTAWGPGAPYQVIVRVRYKDKVWEEQRAVSALSGKSLEKIIVSFKFIKTKTIVVAAAINNILKKSIKVLWRK